MNMTTTAIIIIAFKEEFGMVYAALIGMLAGAVICLFGEVISEFDDNDVW